MAMDMIRVRSFAVLIAFICALVPGSSEGNRKFSETPLGYVAPANFLEIDEDTAELVWIHCREELEESAETFDDVDSYVLQTADHGDSEIKSDAMFARRIIHKTISDLPPPVKYGLVECLRKKNVPSLKPGVEAGPKGWIIKFQEMVIGWSNIHGRSLKGKRPSNPDHVRRWWEKRQHILEVTAAAQKRRHHKAETPALAVGTTADALDKAPVQVPLPPPTPAPHVAPTTMELLNEDPLSVSPTLDSASAPSRGVESPNYAPAPSSTVPSSSPSLVLQAPQKSPGSSLVPVLNDSPFPSSVTVHPPRPPHSPHNSENSSSYRHSNDGNRQHNTAVIAGATVGGFSLIALLLVCCLKNRKNRVGPRERQRFDKPIIALSSSSSDKSITVGKTTNNNYKTQSGDNNSSVGGGQSSEASAGGYGNTGPPLPLPPGRAALTPAAPPPAAPPPPPPKPPAPRAPPPPIIARPPPNPPKLGKKPMPPQGRPSVGNGNELAGEADSQKTKLKPFFWDKVMANPDHSMVWHDIKSGSFQFNEEMMESLFGYVLPDKDKKDGRKDGSNSPITYIQIIDPKKAQNLAILLKALNVTTEEVYDALQEGNELPIELTQTLLKMAPTTEEELKLRLYNGDLAQLGPAERFLKVIVDIPYAFKRLETLVFMSSFHEEVASTKESFRALEVACTELRNSRLFLKLLEAVLKTGNRMNDGTYRGGAQAFKLDTLLKLSDVKGTDGKTTLLHFVVQEIIRSEGVRAARKLKESRSLSSVKTEDLVEDYQETPEYYRDLGLQAVSSLSCELVNVKKASVIDGDILTTTVAKLGTSFKKARDLLNGDMKNVEEKNEFHDTVANFLRNADDDITELEKEEKRIMTLVKNTGDYFHGNAGKDEGLRLFVIVCDFLVMLDKACKVVKNSTVMPQKAMKKDAPASLHPQESHLPPLLDFHQKLSPAIKERWVGDDSSSDEES